MLVNGAGGAVGGYAVQLAAAADAHVIATGSPRSAEHLRALGADEVVDHTGTDVTAAVTGPVDVLLNLASITAERMAALTALVRDGGVVVNTVPGTRPPATRPAACARSACSCAATPPGSRSWWRWSTGELRIDVTRRVPLAELATVHAEADAGTLRGKVVVVPPSA